MTTSRTFARRAGTALPFALAALLIASGSALAQGQPAQRDRERQQNPDRPLGGPPVENRRPGQAEQRFSDPMGREPGGQFGMQRQGVRHPEFMAVVWMLSDEEAPAVLRLTPEQEKEISKIDREFQDASREHAEKLRDLARSAREAGAGDAPAAPGAGEGEQGDRPRPMQGRRISEEDREKLQQLRASMPSPADAQAKVFAQLTETQREFVEDELEYRRQVMERQRAEEMMRRREAMREGGAEGRGGFMGRGGPEAQAQRQRVGRIMMRLQQLPPEEREALVMRLEQELERRAKELGLEDLPERGWGQREGGGDRRRMRDRDGEGQGDGERPQRRRRGGEAGEGAPPLPPR